MDTWAEGSLLGFDLETTGTDPETAVPVQYALVAVDGGKETKSRCVIVDPGCEIPEDAVAIHGISSARARAEGIPLDVAVAEMVEALARAEAHGRMVAGMNLVYDLTVLDRCARRAIGEGLIERGWAGTVADALVIDRHAVPRRRGKRRLDELCAHHGIPRTLTHDAGADARDAVSVLRVMAARHHDVGTMGPTDLTRAEAVWHREWASTFSGYLESIGRNPLTPGDYEWPIRSRRDH